MCNEQKTICSLECVCAGEGAGCAGGGSQWMLWVPGSSHTEDTVLVQKEKVLGKNRHPVSPVAWAEALLFSGLFFWAAEEQGSQLVVWEQENRIKVL